MMTATLTSTKRTDELSVGDIVRIPATLNSCERVVRVEAVGPWMLTTGPHAGQQATDAKRGNNGRPLMVVTVHDLSGCDHDLCEANPAVTADHEWATVGVVAVAAEVLA